MCVFSFAGAAGSAFFENTLSLTFSSLMFVVLLLSLAGSHRVRMVLGLASMVGWSYMFFFLLAFRMTGPMSVMIWSMLTSDVFRFLTVFAVFLLAFAQSFYVLFDGDGFAGFVTSVQRCFLCMLGDFDFDDYSHSPFSLLTYVVVVTILLLNLLIAMMVTHTRTHNQLAVSIARDLAQSPVACCFNVCLTHRAIRDPPTIRSAADARPEPSRRAMHA